jgi:putative ABC transport system permease protein
MTGLFQDVKFALRLMAKNPWFTLVAVLTLGLGIGVNSAGFSLANTAWWQKLPFPNPQEVVVAAISDGSTPPSYARMSLPEFTDVQSRAKSFKAIAAFGTQAMVVSSEGNPGQRFRGARVTPNLFSFLGVKPILGRDFTAADDQWGQPAAVLISHDLWQTRYEGKDDVVGRRVRLDSNPAVIIGVMPPGFKFPDSEQLWTPIRQWGGDLRGWRYLNVFARLAEGVGIEQARAEVRGLAQAMARDHPDTNKGHDALVVTFMDWFNEPDESFVLQIILGAVGFILLIACANTANLLLSRAIQRAREVSVRTALGASRWRIARQVLVESLMLSLAGGVLGVLIGQAGVRWFAHTLKSSGVELTYWLSLDMDYRIFAYCFAICVVTGIGFGSIPAIQISRPPANDNLKEGSHQTTGGSRARRMAAALLVAEIAMTVMLVAESSLLLRDLLATTRFNSGMDTRNLITARLDIPYSTYQNENRPALLEGLVERFQRPDRLTTFAYSAPMEGTWNMPLELGDRSIADAAGNLPYIGTLPVGNNYFSALNVRITRGRGFEAGDGRPGADVVIVSQRFARKYWPAQDPLGKRLRLTLAPSIDKTPWLTVIGVSSDIVQNGSIQLGADPVVYVPYRINPRAGAAAILVRSAQTEATIRELRAELGKIDPDLAPYSIMSFDELRRQANWGNQFFTTLVGILSLMALIMASIGLYGVTAHGVNQRRREIGIRSALGASRFRVVWMIFRQSLPRIVTGLAIGLAGGALLSRLTTTFVIVVVDSQDPVIFLSTFLLITLVTGIAVLIPALRAALLNPCDALRSE